MKVEIKDRSPILCNELLVISLHSETDVEYNFLESIFNRQPDNIRLSITDNKLDIIMEKTRSDN